MLSLEIHDYVSFALELEFLLPGLNPLPSYTFIMNVVHMLQGVYAVLTHAFSRARLEKDSLLNKRRNKKSFTVDDDDLTSMIDLLIRKNSLLTTIRKKNK